jgi:adenylate cyclase
LVTVSRASWALDDQRVAITRDLVVGFADLVEYTRTSRALTPAELTDAIGRFESRVGEIVPRHGGRVVKLIGDEIMFVLPDAASAMALALELARELAHDPELPEVRIGLAAGPVVSHAGDYYGDVVNLAARLVKAADPGSALMTESPFERTSSEEPVELPLKGYDTPVRAWRLPLR